MGGNDAHFAHLVEACAIQLYCYGDPGLRYQMEQDFAVLPAKLRSMYADMLAEARNARVFVLGYPRLFSRYRTPGTLCAGFDSYEARFANDVVARLNKTIRDAVASMGSSRLVYVDVENAFDGHELCTPDPYANGIRWDKRVYSFHPNGKGHEQLAKEVYSALNNAPPA